MQPTFVTHQHIPVLALTRVLSSTHLSDNLTPLDSHYLSSSSTASSLASSPASITMRKRRGSIPHAPSQQPVSSTCNRTCLPNISSSSAPAPSGYLSDLTGSSLTYDSDEEEEDEQLEDEAFSIYRDLCRQNAPSKKLASSAAINIPDWHLSQHYESRQAYSQLPDTHQALQQYLKRVTDGYDAESYRMKCLDTFVRDKSPLVRSSDEIVPGKPQLYSRAAVRKAYFDEDAIW